MSRVDLLYLACNRLAFTQETFATLIRNTDWDQVKTLFVYDDGSVDGTQAWLKAHLDQVPAATRFEATHYHSPVSAMVHFIESATAPILAKTDNDAMLPPSWLRQSLDVLDRHPELALLGIEALYPHIDDQAFPRDYTPAEFISGLGLYRRSAFAHSRPRAYRKYFGLEEWQVAQGPGLVRGWITPALPVFLLDRMPTQPWSTLSDDYVHRGWQRGWPKYSAECTLWRWRWPEIPRTIEPPVPTASPQFVAALRIKNESAYIREVLERALALCSRALIFDDHSTDNTLSICRSFGEAVTIYESPFDGFDEVRDKNYLLQKVIATDGAWVLWIDGDEVLEKNGPQRIRQAINNCPHTAAFSLQIAYLWNSPQLVRVDGIYSHFRRPSLFRLKGQHFGRLHFQATGFGGNLHCGNIPLGLVGITQELNVRLKHYGYMDQTRRMAKYEWYRRIDPHNQLEDEYRHLIETPGARHAPGPTQLVSWQE